jgi:2-amino-4-hydroxy-6-hydroxymethyldihydropteridine diphosphokinase
MTKVFLGLGANLGDKKRHIHDAIVLLGKKITGITVAKFYETKPQYYEHQDAFINTVISGYTDLHPSELLKFTKEVEKQVGRQERFHYGPREVDVDILFYDDLAYKDEYLTIPHPLLQEREFVLKPFLDLEPNFVHPVLKKTIRELYESLAESKKSVIA